MTKVTWRILISLLTYIVCEGAVLSPDEAILDCKSASNNCFRKYNKTDPKEIIKTPNFGYNNYPDNKRCCWLLESPEPSAEIKVNFHYFNLEPNKKCTGNDYVQFYKQKNNEKTWQLIDDVGTNGLCGRLKTLRLEETTKRVLIEFHSDGSVNFEGFNATFVIYVTDTRPQIIFLGNVNEMEALVPGKNPAHDVMMEERDEITIQCKAEATPPPEKYTWKYAMKTNSNIILTEDHHFVKTVYLNGSIRLHNLKIENSGNLTCTAANRNENTSLTVPFTVKEKCNCPKEITTSWYDFPPYTEYERSNKLKGIFYALLQDMVATVCGDCKGGHGKTEIIWNREKNKPKDEKTIRGLSDVKSEIEDGDTDMYFPISGGKNDDQYRNMYYFLPMVDSPGVAFLIVGDPEGASAKVIFDSILQGWPILVLLVVMSALSGIIMWMLDTYWNEEQFPRNFSEGIVEGFWWAFVTMTTVGYGDIAPKGVPGRLFAVVWILTGLVIIAIFTGVITTSLTVVALESSVKLYGSTVGAINNTAEFRMGVIKNAKMLNYSSFDTLANAMSERQVNGCLVDSYVAAYYKNKFKKNRVNNIFESTKAYGVVLGKRLSKKYLHDLFSEYLEKNKARVTKFIEENTDTLEAESSSAASEKASDLFDPESPLFQSSLHGCLILLLVLSFGGLVFEYAYLRPRHRMIQAAKNLEMVESEEVKEMAQRAKLLKEALLEEVDNFYDRWSEKYEILTDKHKEEQKTILSKGSSPGPTPARQWPPPFGDDVISIPELDNQQPESSSNSSSGGSTKSLIKASIPDDIEKA